jgi:hypothetical protein
MSLAFWHIVSKGKSAHCPVNNVTGLAIVSSKMIADCGLWIADLSIRFPQHRTPRNLLNKDANNGSEMRMRSQ